MRATACEAGCHRKLRARGGLDHPPLLVDHDMVAEAIRLGDVVGDHHRRLSPLGEHGAQLVAQGAALRQIQRGQWLVEQQQRRVGGQRAPQRHPLPLAT